MSSQIQRSVEKNLESENRSPPVLQNNHLLLVTQNAQIRTVNENGHISLVKLNVRPFVEHDNAERTIENGEVQPRVGNHRAVHHLPTIKEK